MQERSKTEKEGVSYCQMHCLKRCSRGDWVIGSFFDPIDKLNAGDHFGQRSESSQPSPRFLRTLPHL
jgi:hypothetical protein